MFGYPVGVKGYRLWCLEPDQKKIITSRDVVFEEIKMPYKNKEAVKSKSESSTLKVELFDNFKGVRSLAEGENEDTQSEESENEAQPASQQDLSDYMLARDRVRREIHPPSRYRHAELLCFALAIAEKVEYSEPKNYEEEIASAEREFWIQAMKEELESLLKNCT